MNEAPKCAECGGEGVQFRASGIGTQFRICPKWREPGHPTEQDIRQRIREAIAANMPASGRFA